MKILTNIESDDLSERFNAKAPAFYGFGTETTSKTINVSNTFDGQCILIDSNLTFTLVHAGLRTNGVVRFVQISSASSNVQTSDDAVPTQSLDLNESGFVDCIWTGSKWVFVGNYTF